MNVVGKIGQHMIDHQEIIEYILLGILALIIIVWIIRLIVNAVRRKDVLEEIDSQVKDIHSTVNTISQTQQASMKTNQKEELDKVEPISSKSCSDKTTGGITKTDRSKDRVSTAGNVCAQAQIEEPGEKNEVPRVQTDLTSSEDDKKTNRERMETRPANSQSASENRISDFTYGWGHDLMEAEQRNFEMQMQGEGRDSFGGQINFDKYIGRDTYNSRDCGRDKHGNVYTEEALKKQIR